MRHFVTTCVVAACVVAACVVLSVAVALPHAVHAQTGGEWGALGADGQRTAQGREGGESAPWRVDDLTGSVVASPVVGSGNRAYVKTYDGETLRLYALDTQSGEPTWPSPVELGGIADSTQPVLTADGQMFVVTANGGEGEEDGSRGLSRIELTQDGTTPAVEAVFDPGEEDGSGETSITGTPALSETGLLYIPTSNGILFGFDTASLSVVGQITPSSEAPLTDPALTGTGDVVVGTDGAKVHIVSADLTQSKRLLQTSSEEPLVTPATVDGQGRAFIVSSAGTLYALRASLDQNNTLWTRDVGPGGGVRLPVVDVERGLVLVSADDGDGSGRIQTFRLDGGEPGWSVDVAEGVPSAVAVSRFGDVLFGVDRGGGGQVRAVTASQGDPLWTVDTDPAPERVQPSLSSNGIVFVGANATVRAVAGPVPVASPNPVDFGAVPVGEASATQSVTIRNTGTTALIVGSVSLNGAGFSIDADLGEFALLPDESRTVDVAWTPQSRGPATGTLTFFTGVGTETVDLVGTGLAAAVSLGATSIGFGDVSVDGGRTEQTITVSNTGNADLGLTGASITGANSEDFSVVSGATGTLEPDASQVLRVAFEPQDSGERSAQLTLNTTVGTESIDLSGFGAIYELTATPSSVDFGSVPKGNTVTGTVTIENTGNAVLDFTNVSISGDAAGEFSVSGVPTSGTLAASESVTADLTYTPQDTGGDRVDLVIDAGIVSASVTIELFGEGTLVNQFSVNPSSIDFGGVPVNDVSGVQTVTLTNQSSTDIEVDNLALAAGDSDFTIDGTVGNTTLSQGGSFDVNLTFGPSTRGGTSGELVIDVTTGNGPETIRVALSGTGQAPDLAVSTNTLVFGEVSTGETTQQSFDVINEGEASLTLQGATVSGTNATAFRVVSGDTGTLAPGASQSLTIEFAPQRAGTRSAQIAVDSDGGSALIDAVGGGLQGQPVLEPVTLEFGTVSTGGGAETARLYLTNDGNAAFDVESVGVGGTDPDGFSVTDPSTTTLAPGERAPLDVTFAPDTGGAVEAQIRVQTSAGPTTAGLSGQGAGVDVQFTAVRAGAPVDVTVAVEGFTPTNGTFYVRASGRLAYEALDLTEASADTWQTTIPAEQVTERGFDYYVGFGDDITAAVVAQSLASSSDPEHVRVRFDGLTPPIDVGPQTPRMISIPAVPDDSTLAGMLADDYGRYDPTQWRLARWDAAAQRYRRYEGAQTLPPGASAWLVTRTGTTFDVDAGLSASAARPHEVRLQPGWNQIAVPYAFPVRWRAVDGSGRVEAPVVYDGDRYRYGVDVLEPWTGYFVYNPTGEVVTIRIPTVSASVDPSMQSTAKDSLAKDSFARGGSVTASAAYTLRLSARVDGRAGAGGNAYLGLHSRATSDRDRLDFAGAPGFGSGADLRIAEDGERLAGSFRPTGTDGQAWDVEVRAASSETFQTSATVRVRLHDSGARPDGFRTYVVDLDRRRLIPVEGRSFAVDVGAGDTVRRLRVIVGTERFAKQNSDDVPLESYDYALKPTTPNPFTDAVTIRYSLAAQQQVQVEVFNLLGQRVRRLVDDTRGAGTYELTWDGTVHAGRPAGSGVYFVRLTAGDFTATRKMTLVR